ncbi:MAG: tripartite tricarboxylate transporter TctB family protein [Caldilineaceae bacterium]
MNNHLTDRISGLVLLLVAIGYTWQATSLTSKMPADPLGPSAFPLMLGILLGICSLWLIIKPDPNPTWPHAKAWLQMGMIIGSLVLYAYTIRPLGFVIATTIEMIILSIIFKGPPVKTVAAAVVMSLCLYFLFDFGLGLNLPNGLLPF